MAGPRGTDIPTTSGLQAQGIQQHAGDRHGIAAQGLAPTRKPEETSLPAASAPHQARSEWSQGLPIAGPQADLATWPRLSACITSHDHEHHIDACLSSLAFCDEIVVVDAFSTDATVTVARAFGARVFQRPFDGLRNQRATAVRLATHEWVICMDADERIGAELRDAIRDARMGGFANAAGFRFTRRSDYFGRALRHGHERPERVLRLFDKSLGGWRRSRELTESASVRGPVHTLTGDLLHVPGESLEQQLVETQRRARLKATHAFAYGYRASLLGLVLAPAWQFWRGYLLRLGFLDGWRGLVYAYLRANYVRQKTIMLWLLQNGHAVADPVERPRR